MKRFISILLIATFFLFFFTGCRESHRRVSVRVYAHGHYSHNCGYSCSHYRPMIIHHSRPVVVHRSSPVIVHRSSLVIVHRSTHKPMIHKPSPQIHRGPQMRGGSRSGSRPEMGRQMRGGSRGSGEGRQNRGGGSHSRSVGRTHR